MDYKKARLIKIKHLEDARSSEKDDTVKPNESFTGVS